MGRVFIALSALLAAGCAATPPSPPPNLGFGSYLQVVRASGVPFLQVSFPSAKDCRDVASMQWEKAASDGFTMRCFTSSNSGSLQYRMEALRSSDATSVVVESSRKEDCEHWQGGMASLGYKVNRMCNIQ